MPDKNTPTPEEIEKLEDEAEDLERRAEQDGVIPDDDLPENGVGPQTAVVP